MLLQSYYRALLAFCVFAAVPLCEASRNIRFGLRKLKEKAAPAAEGTLSHKAELKRRQYGSEIPGPVTDVTTEYDTVVIAPSSLAPVTVTFISTSSLTTTAAIDTPISTLLGQTSSTISQPPVTSASSIPLCNSGYYLCAAEYNGGCCMSGLSCAISSCVPPVTATGIQRTCGPQSLLCPAEQNYGCCPKDFACGATECLSRITAASTVAGLITTAQLYTTVEKATASDLYAKQSTIASANLSPTSSVTESPLGSGVPLSGIAMGGIIAGCVIGVLVFVLAGWCTYRRLKNRSNFEPPGGVSTTNYYDPNATSSTRTPASYLSPRYLGVTQVQGYFPKQPEAVPVAGHPLNTPLAPQPVEVMAEMPANTVFYPQHNNVAYEVEGTTPPARSKRWSKPFSGW